MLIAIKLINSVNQKVVDLESTIIRNSKATVTCIKKYEDIEREFKSFKKSIN